MKRHQHFIPRTYLKHFSEDKKQIFSYNKENDTFKKIGINDVCVEKDFYTLKYLKNEDKYLLEDYFSNEIESKLPCIFNLLINEKRQTISITEKRDILKVVLSMHFRTPKNLNKFVALLDEIYDKIKNNDSQKIIFLGVELSLSDKTIQEIKKELKEKIRIDYLSVQLDIFSKYIEYKLEDGLSVFEITNNQQLITSDNPVSFINETDSSLNLFNINNSIYIPLNPTNVLFIAPKKFNSIKTEIFYQKDSFMLATVINNCTYENSEKWVLGFNQNLMDSIKTIKEYLKPYNQEENPLISTFEDKIILMNAVRLATRKGITNENLELIQSLKNMIKWNDFHNHIDLVECVDEFKKYGLKI